MARKIISEPFIEGNSHYQDTELLLKLYRKVNAILLKKVSTTKRYFEKEYGCNVTEFLDTMKKYGIDLNDDIELVTSVNEIKYLHNILSIVDSNIKHIEENSENGKVLAACIYSTYITKHKLSLHERRKNVTKAVNPDQLKLISERTFFRRLDEAMKEMDYWLWYNDKDSQKIEEFLQREAVKLNLIEERKDDTHDRT